MSDPLQGLTLPFGWSSEPGTSCRRSACLSPPGASRTSRDSDSSNSAFEISRRGIEVDEWLGAAENVWAIGDATGIALFTHVGKYQARVAAENVAGGRAKADYRAIPAVAFTDPQIATVGTTEGEGLVSARWNVEDTSRASTYERPARHGFVKVVADPKRRVLVGAVAVGPEAGEWCQQLTLAVRAEVPIEVLLDVIQPFPTFSEAVFFALQELAI